MSEFAGRASVDVAMQLLRDGKVRECIDCANRVISADPDNGMAYTILGAAYLQVGERALAIGAFQEAAAVDPCARSHYNLGAAYEQSGRVKDAIEQFQLAVQADPSYKPAADALERLKMSAPDSPTDGSTGSIS